jgi:hypothetical protein
MKEKKMMVKEKKKKETTKKEEKTKEEDRKKGRRGGGCGWGRFEIQEKVGLAKKKFKFKVHLKVWFGLG